MRNALIALALVVLVVGAAAAALEGGHRSTDAGRDIERVQSPDVVFVVVPQVDRRMAGGNTPLPRAPRVVLLTQRK